MHSNLFVSLTAKIQECQYTPEDRQQLAGPIGIKGRSSHVDKPFSLEIVYCDD